jgi:hypothetical protein
MGYAESNGNLSGALTMQKKSPWQTKGDDLRPGEDELVPVPRARVELDASPSTWQRWRADPELVAAGFPATIYIQQKQFVSRRALEQFKKNMIHCAVEKQRTQLVAESASA